MAEVASRVVGRFRPINKREKAVSKQKGWTEADLRPCVISVDETSVKIDYGGRSAADFTLDRFLGETTTQTYAFEVIALPVVMDCLRGINGCVFAYGQTSSGKTFSMFGPEVPIEIQEEMVELLGIIPQASMIIFEYLNSEKAAEVAKWNVDLSVMEIYVGDSLRDLLYPKKKGDKSLKLRDGPKGVFIQGLKSIPVNTLTDVLSAIARANKSRTVSATKMNATSSRSHSIFRLKVTTELQSGTQRTATLNFCDLAGSEKIGKTGAVGKQASEGMAINLSLTCLGRVINALVTHRSPPFRESALTHVLKDSLQGNCKTTILVCLSPHRFNVTETVNSLRFAMRAKLIKNKVKANKVLSRQELQKIIKDLNKEIKTLRDKLGGKLIDTMDKQQVEQKYCQRTLYVKFSWRERKLEDLPHGLDHEKSQILNAIRIVGKEKNLKNLKLNFGIRNEEKDGEPPHLVIMIMVYENEYYDAEQILIARDKIHMGLKAMENGIFSDADDDCVGCVSAEEQAILDVETQKIMMNDLKALREQHMEDMLKIERWEVEMNALRVENDQLKFGIERLDELAYAYDMEMVALQEKLDEQSDTILELLAELGVTPQAGYKSSDENNEYVHQLARTEERLIPQRKTRDVAKLPAEVDSSNKELTQKSSYKASVRDLLGTGSAIKVVSTDMNGLVKVKFSNLPKDKRDVARYDKDKIKDLCSLYRSSLKKVLGAYGTPTCAKSSRVMTKNMKKDEEKNQLIRLSLELMEQLGAFIQGTEELRQELLWAREKSKTQSQKTEALALELDKYKNVHKSVCSDDSNIQVSLSPKHCVNTPASRATVDKLKLQDILHAQQRQLVDITRKSVNFSLLPSLFEEDEKFDSGNRGVYHPSKTLLDWTCEEVHKWLTAIDGGIFAEVAPKMRDDDVNGECLLSLTRHELKHTYNMPRHKVTLLFEKLFDLDPLHRMKMGALYSKVIKAEKDEGKNISNYHSPRLQKSMTDCKSELVIGDVVFLKGLNNQGRGRVCYIGGSSIGDGEWVGLELVDGQGEHDGEYLGKRYFRCEKGQGVLVRRSNVELRGKNEQMPKWRKERAVTLADLHKLPSYYQQMEVALCSQVKIGNYELSSDSGTFEYSSQSEKGTSL